MNKNAVTEMAVRYRTDGAAVECPTCGAKFGGMQKCPWDGATLIQLLDADPLAVALYRDNAFSGSKRFTLDFNVSEPADEEAARELVWAIAQFASGWGAETTDAFIDRALTALTGFVKPEEQS